MAEHPLKIFEKVDPELLKLVQDTNSLALADGALSRKSKLLYNRIRANSSNPGVNARYHSLSFLDKHAWKTGLPLAGLPRRQTIVIGDWNMIITVLQPSFDLAALLLLPGHRTLLKNKLLGWH